MKVLQWEYLIMRDEKLQKMARMRKKIMHEAKSPRRGNLCTSLGVSEGALDIVSVFFRSLLLWESGLFEYPIVLSDGLNDRRMIIKSLISAFGFAARKPTRSSWRDLMMQFFKFHNFISINLIFLLAIS